MDMQNYTTPFANTGDKEEFSIGTDPTGKVSLEKGWTELYQLRPEEGGLFILRKVFNQMMKLVSTDTVTWKIQSFPNWIDDKGDGTPYAYPKNAIVKYTDGNSYVSKMDNNTALPTDTNNWVNFEDFGTININALPDKPIPADTDNFAIQEVGGDLKKVSYKSLFDKVSIAGSATFNGTTQTINLTNVGNITLAIGDVIEVSGTTSNNKLFTVESIPNANQIVVNYEHRGTSTPVPSKRLINETATATIRLYNRAKNAPLGQGQGWCTPASGRLKNQTYSNYTNRVIQVNASMNGNTACEIQSTVDGISTGFNATYGASSEQTVSTSFPVPVGGNYSVSTADPAGDTIIRYTELR